MVKFGDSLAACALAIHRDISSAFPPTATKFHYQFNMRDLQALVQGLCNASVRTTPTSFDLARLFVHELHRVYGDKMVDDADLLKFDDILRKHTRRGDLDELNQDKLYVQPNTFLHLSSNTATRQWSGSSEQPVVAPALYRPVIAFDQLRRILTDALQSHNETNASMNLVLFNDAMLHVVRISRIIRTPRGHGLLVGVGGNGKQSLAKLAAFLANVEGCTIALRPGYTIADFHVR